MDVSSLWQGIHETGDSVTFQSLMPLTGVILSLLGLYWILKLIVAECYPELQPVRVVVQAASVRTVHGARVMLSIEWRRHDTRSSYALGYAI